MRESQSKKVEKYRNATAENAAKILGSSFFFEQLFFTTNFENLARDAMLQRLMESKLYW